MNIPTFREWRNKQMTIPEFLAEYERFGPEYHARCNYYESHGLRRWYWRFVANLRRIKAGLR